MFGDRQLSVVGDPEYLGRIGVLVVHELCGVGKKCRTTMSRVSPIRSSTTNCGCNGLDGLRVIDASVMPAVTPTNTNARTIMIAEKVRR